MISLFEMKRTRELVYMYERSYTLVILKQERYVHLKEQGTRKCLTMGARDACQEGCATKNGETSTSCFHLEEQNSCSNLAREFLTWLRSMGSNPTRRIIDMKDFNFD